MLFRSAKDSITQNEESKIDYDYAVMLRNNKFEQTVEIETSNNAPLNYLFFSPPFELWNLEPDTFRKHTIT